MKVIKESLLKWKQTAKRILLNLMKKNKLAENFYKQDKLAYQKIIVDCHHQALEIEKNIASLNAIAIEMNVKKLPKYKKTLEKEPKRILGVSSAVRSLHVSCETNKKRVEENIMLTELFNGKETE